MRNTVAGWSVLLTKLGITRKKSRRCNRPNAKRRPLRLEALEQWAMLATYTVNVDFDEADGILDGQISLRDAVLEADAGDTINFSTDPAHALNGATINLSQSLGEIDIELSVTIDASMLPNGITISGNDQTPEIRGDGIRIFNITDPTNGTNAPLVTMIGLTLTGADPASDSHAGEGGGLRLAGARLRPGLSYCGLSGLG